MGNLKSFLIVEELKISHAERFLAYVERYHEHVFHDLKKNLHEAWDKTVHEISKKHPIDPGSKQEALLKNPKSTLQASVSNTPTKLITSRSPVPLEVSPSVKIPLVYSQEECKLFLKELLESSRTAFEKTAHGWSEIFNYEHKGRITPWFKIIGDHEEVRFQLAITTGDYESYKTLYSVRVEYGKKGSKTKDFDRLYLVNLINR